MVRTTLSAALILLSLPAQAETPTEWIELGARVHGAFGVFIPIGIRIGLDAKERIKAEPRGLAVTYYTGEKAAIAGIRPGEPLHAARHASQSLRCCAGVGWWSPELSAVQMMANGSNAKWPAGPKPHNIACSAIE